MSEFHTKEQIENYEERWQKRFYIPSGNGKDYIHVCELCHYTNTVERIIGGHYLCMRCKKKLRLNKPETIKKWIENGKRLRKEHPDLKPFQVHPSTPSKEERKKAWKKIIRMDYLITMFNKYCKYE